MKNVIFAFALTFLLTMTITAQNNPATNSAETKDDSSQAEDLFNQGVEYYDAKDYKKAIKLWEQAAKSLPDEPAVFYGLGLAYYNTRQYTKSVAAFQHVIEIDPNYRSAKQNLATAESAKKAEKEKQKATWAGVLNAVSEAVGDDDKSESGQTRSGVSNKAAAESLAASETPNPAGGFAAGHRLDGRYKLRDAYKYTTFYADGTVETSAAAAGDFRGGDYSSGGGTGKGTYTLSGNNLTINFDNGSSNTYQIEIWRISEAPNYREVRPTVIKLNGVFFDNVDD